MEVRPSRGHKTCQIRNEAQARSNVVGLRCKREDMIETYKLMKGLYNIPVDNWDLAEAKSFFEQNYAHIYYIFYDVFISVEGDLRQRANKAHKEEFDNVLFIFEKILLLLPELIHKRWQYHSMGRLLKKLLHPANTLKIRREGMRLFIIWYMIMQENATEECHMTYASLVPMVGSTNMPLDQDMYMVRVAAAPFAGPEGSSKKGAYLAAVNPVEICPVIPMQPNEKLPENLTKYFLESLMTFMVSEVTKIEWSNREMQEFSFNFVFNRFKKYYLLHIFPDFSRLTSIYDPILDLPEERPPPIGDKVLQSCQEVVVRWVAIFTHHTKKPPEQPPANTPVPDGESGDQASPTGSRHDPSEQRPPGSNNSTLSGTSNLTEKDTCSVSSEDHSVSEYEIVKRCLYSTRENVNLIHEIFRQAFLFPFQHTGAMKRVIGVYKEWLQTDTKPLFLHEAPEASPRTSPTPKMSPRDSVDSSSPVEMPNSLPLSNITEENASISSATATPDTPDKDKAWMSTDPSDGMRPGLRNDSYLGAITDISDSEVEQNVKAGMQRFIQLFVTHTSNVFLLQSESKLIDEQVDMCKRVLNIYRFMVMHHHMTPKTWEQLLLILLKITSGVLQATPSTGKERTLGGQLAQPIFQTLIVTWIKANLNVLISSELWDQFLVVLSSLTQWEELIREWAKTMDTLTRVLARQVYNLDLQDLPLDRLTEQKKKKKRGGENRAAAKNSVDRTFSRGWSQNEKSTNDSNAESKKLQSHSETPSSPSASSSTTEVSSRFLSENPDLDASFNIMSKSRVKRERSISGSEQQKTDATEAEMMEPLLRSNSDSNLSTAQDGRTHNPYASPGNSFNSSMSSQRSRKSTCSSVVSDSQGDSACEEVDGDTSSAQVSPDTVHTSESDTPSLNASVIPGFTDATSINSDAGSVKYDVLTDQSTDSISLDKSELDAILRGSREPSIVSHDSKPSSRSQSPISDIVMQGLTSGADKNSITPDRESIHIDVAEENHLEKTLQSDMDDAYRSVLAGGSVQGWTPDVSVVLWRRMLGILGDINHIEDPNIHTRVYEYLCELMTTMLKMRTNQSVTSDGMMSPPPPELIPPLQIVTPWLFEALNLPQTYKKGKLLAYRLLCELTIRRHDSILGMDHLSQFYRVLHYSLVDSDQDVINELVQGCGLKFFSTPLDGNTMLMLDFIHAASTVVASTNVKETPRAEAISLLGSLLCFPNQFGEMPVLKPKSVDITHLTASDSKDHIITMLLKAGKKEPAGLARCIAISSLGVFLYEELTHRTMHCRLKEAINVLLVTLRFNQKNVAQVAADMLLLLCDHVDALLNHQPDLPKRIIEVTASTISSLLPGLEHSHEDDKTLMVSMIFCLLEWTMRVPIEMLLGLTESNTTLIYKVFRVLNLAVNGVSPHGMSSKASVASFSELIQDDEFDSLRDGTMTPNTPKTPNDHIDIIKGHRRAGSDIPKITENNIVKLAARTALSHLVNHLGHFPMGSGAGRLNSEVQEQHDSAAKQMEDLNTEIFSQNNVQFFVLNNSTLVSFVEVPAMDMPGGGVTAGLTTAKTVTRAIIRDSCGKFCWDSSILYGPPRCRAGSFPEEPQPRFHVGDRKSLTEEVLGEFQAKYDRHITVVRNPTELPDYSTTQDHHDNLNDLLQYIGHTSPECLLHPGEPLNIPPAAPSSLNCHLESKMVSTVLTQRDEEMDYFMKHKADNSMVAQPLTPSISKDENSPFHLCRHMVNQLGLMSWGKRAQVDLLKKNEKLLRELKHLDSQRCRETHKIAVFYIGPGQEDKQSLLSNKGGSKQYEDFLAGLGWEVDLETHCGFLGGLQRNKSTGTSAPYYATSTLEVIFHVSTRMPSDTEDERHRKLRHLGNDEVHIIWSEHTRDYRRGIIPTEFGDVIIVISPLHNGLYRIHIDRKPEVPYFGPLFDGAIVDHAILPGLVRATAINASRTKRATMPYYMAFYEERTKYLETLIQQHKQATMFEEFAGHVFAPVLAPGSDITGMDFSLPSPTSSTHTPELNGKPLTSAKHSKGKI
ncbi:unnamed protein product [Owenia fusiformis]|uniref:Rap-GAP domain-containing protein n=1 Tax=Owenia fusiformis TaxID=6347 RepID=A0A8S4P9N1_OWEFU|nr:unnamed protein product [Owenia fusiformis]